MKLVIGSDEVGYGAIAGPIYVVGVAAPESWRFPGLRDSKKMSPKQRTDMFDPLSKELRGKWSLASFTSEEIDELGVSYCLDTAHSRALKELMTKFSKEDVRVIVDGSQSLAGLPEAIPIPKADDLYQAVSAASVLAKVLRDELMEIADAQYPGYGFAKHKGYGTEEHVSAIRKSGLCPIHRRSYTKKLLRNLEGIALRRDIKEALKP